MYRLLIACPDPGAAMAMILTTAAVSDPLLVGLVSTTLTALYMHDDCEADFGCFWAKGAVRINDTVIAASPSELEIIIAQELRFYRGGLIELLVDGLAQVRRIEAALEGWPASMLRVASPDGSSLLKA